MSYLNVKGRNVDEKHLKILRKIVQPTLPTRQALTVNHNGTIHTFTLGKNGEYYSKTGQSLTGLMEATVGLGNNKITIS
jgi:hypothetical protein